MEKTMMPALLIIAWLNGCSGNMVSGEPPDLITIRPEHGASAKIDAGRGADILLRAAKAYEEFKSYKGKTDVKDSWSYAKSGAEMSNTASAAVIYSKPNKLRIDGQDTRGNPFTIVTDGRTTWSSWRRKGSGAFKVVPSLKEEVLSWMGVASHATIMIPSALLDIEWERENMFLPRGKLLPAFATKATLDGQEKLDGQPCYRVVCEREIATWVFWVDAKTHLLRKCEARCGPQQSAAQKKYGGGGTSGKITSSVMVQTYTVEAINQPVEDSVFRP